MMAFESSIALPNVTGAAAQGYWPAFWSLGNSYRTGTAWPTSGEIDTMESMETSFWEYRQLLTKADQYANIQYEVE